MKARLTRTVPLAQLADTELLGLSRYWGKVGKDATRRFLATLPEIARRGLFRRCRCHSIYEFAAKFAGASREVVDDVLLVYRRLGSFEVLWSLFAAGKVGLSILRQISRHVSADSAAWWADLVQTCTMREIAAVLRQTEEEQASALPLTNTLPAPDAPAPCSPANVSNGNAVLKAAQDGLAPGGDEESRSQPEAALPLTGRSTIGSTAPLPATEHLSGRSEQSVTLTLLAAEILENFLLDYRRRGLTVSKAELLELILRSVALDESLPGLDVGSTHVGPKAPLATESAPPTKALEADAPLLAPPSPAVKRRYRWPRVIVELADIGLTFARTVGGLIPLTAAEAAARGSEKPTAYSTLVAKATEVGLLATGRTPPAIVQLAITIRSAGKCEAGTCTRPIEEFDHLDPYSEHPVHLPDRMVGLCSACHHARHNGLFANLDAPPSAWVRISAGSPRRSTAVDAKVQKIRLSTRTISLPAGLLTEAAS